MKSEIARVPRLWPQSTVVCLGSGPSLCAEDVDYCRGRARVIAVKDAIRLAPWADVLYACGADRSRWWQRHGEQLRDFAGLRYTLDPQAAPWAQVLRHTGLSGIDPDPSSVRTGRNSGIQAINVAVHLGAAKIILLGYDVQAAVDGTDHFFGDHPHGVKLPYAEFRPFFEAIVEPLRALGVAVINASRRTALTCFPRLSIAEALA